ncbi:MAG: hypothetical protein ACM3L6_05690 [Deltaproteobacteria bacterium]
MRDRLFSVLKLTLAILLLPIVVGVTAAFLDGLRATDARVAAAFGWGAIAYLILHIFFVPPAQVFDAGKKMSEEAVGFVFPLVKVAGFCIPIFTLIAFGLYALVAAAWKKADTLPLFVFLASFTFTMHMVFSANALRNKKPGWLKENYLLAICTIYIVNMILIALAFSLLAPNFELADFFGRCGHVAGAIYSASWRQLFEVEGRSRR